MWMQILGFRERKKEAELNKHFISLVRSAEIFFYLFFFVWLHLGLLKCLFMYGGR